MGDFVPGSRVVDSTFGPGTVVRETKIGYLVAFDSLGALELDRPRGSIRGIDGPAPVPKVERPAPRQRAGDGAADPTSRARVAVDALRFGVVPASHLPELTLGYDGLVRWVAANLPRPGEPARAAAVYGSFGSGKSHTMAAVREIARDRGYLAMATEIDGTEISLAQPRELLARLLDHLTGSTDLDGAAPLLSLVQTALKKGAKPVAGRRSPLLQETVSSIERLSTTGRFDDLDDLVERLLGSDPALTRTDFKAVVRDTLDWDDYVRLTYDREYSPRPLICYSPVGERPGNFVEAMVGYATIARSAGFEGLVVTIDELEVESTFSTASKASKVIDLVAALRAEFHGAQPVPGGLGFFLAAVGEDGAIEDKVVSLIVDSNPEPPYTLEPWGRSELLALSQRIHTLYASAHGVETGYDESVARSLFRLIDPNDAIRAFIRGYVARLDVIYGPPYG